MTELTKTELTIRTIVAQYLPGMTADRVSSYADKIHPKEPFHQIGLVDGRFHDAITAVECLFAVDLSDSDREACKCVGDLAKLVDQRTKTREPA